MLILGIDPGLAIMGYGAIRCEGGRLSAVDYGTIETESTVPLPERIQKVYSGMCELIERYRPDAVAFEELFFSKNAKTAIIVGQARGAAIAAACQRVKKIYEYTPLQVKQAITGYGRAEKMQMQLMVKTLLGLPEIPRPDDAADALAVAICHAQTAKMKDALLMK
ncbi:MAG: crossover junction endodeoxyribonuclease RuvC [Bacillota bacterium]|nr:crossover junction endodeoxyribonuclease RuvC [Bacillota bacterium]